MKHRRAKSARRFDVAEFKKLVGDGRVSIAVGVVGVPPGENSHYEADGEDVLVECQVVTMHGEWVSARLGAGPGGIWVVPAVGEEVVLGIADGRLDGHVAILCQLSGGEVPSNAGPGVTVIARGKVVLEADEVVLGHENGQSANVNGVVLASGVDTLTGATYGALGSASTKVKALK